MYQVLVQCVQLMYFVLEYDSLMFQMFALILGYNLNTAAALYCASHLFAIFTAVCDVELNCLLDRSVTIHDDSP